MRTRGAWVKLGVLVLLLALIGWGLQALGIRASDIRPQRVREFVLSFGVLAPTIYLVAYGQPIVPLPASVMTITGGLAFGPLWGVVAALAGASVRACGQFFLARLLGREAVEKLLKGRVANLNQRLGDNSFKTVLLIRLIPNLPFDFQNYGLGFSRVRFGPFALATFLGMIPGSFAFVYLGYSLTDPRHLWKLGLAILIIIGLMAAQAAWKRRHRVNAAASQLQSAAHSPQPS
jgi:uncharacterized membrane protein YdjX (TVP38/TMEM64 family)